MRAVLMSRTNLRLRILSGEFEPERAEFRFHYGFECGWWRLRLEDMSGGCCSKKKKDAGRHMNTLFWCEGGLPIPPARRSNLRLSKARFDVVEAVVEPAKELAAEVV